MDRKASEMREILTVLGVVALSILTGACAPSAQPSARPAAEVEMADEPASDVPAAVFMGDLAAQERVNQNDGFRAMLIWVDGEDESKNFEQRVVALAEKGLVKTRWQFNPTAPIDKATLAYMVYKALGLRGGLNMAVFSNRRYALRELVYRDMMARGADYTYVSGNEFIAILGRADDHRSAGEAGEQLPQLLQD